MMNDIVCGVYAAFTAFVVSSETSGDLWTSVLTALLSAAIFGVINIIVRIITSILEKKGVISSENKKDIDSVADDLLDDGKINNSNHKDKNNSNDKDKNNSNDKDKK